MAWSPDVAILANIRSIDQSDNQIWWNAGVSSVLLSPGSIQATWQTNLPLAENSSIDAILQASEMHFSGHQAGCIVSILARISHHIASRWTDNRFGDHAPENRKSVKNTK